MTDFRGGWDSIPTSWSWHSRDMLRGTTNPLTGAAVWPGWPRCLIDRFMRDRNFADFATSVLCRPAQRGADGAGQCVYEVARDVKCARPGRCVVVDATLRVRNARLQRRSRYYVDGDVCAAMRRSARSHEGSTTDWAGLHCGGACRGVRGS